MLSEGTTNTQNLTASISVTVDNPNSSPTNILISNDVVEEQQPAGTIVGTLSAADADVDDIHTYNLVAGEGDDANDLFTISGNILTTNSIFEVSQEVSHSIRVQATDPQNSSFAKALEIRVVPVQIFVPTMFSPNGDGSNDTFRIRGNGISSVSLRVFDRFGNTMFETNDVNSATVTGWDGTSKGANAPHGIYTWIIKGEFTNGTPISFDGKRSGNIMLVR
jgi:gliding motility-associated-like protein